MNMLFMMFENMCCNLLYPFIIMIQIVNIDIMPPAVFRVIQLLGINPPCRKVMGKDCSLIFYRKARQDSRFVPSGFKPAGNKSAVVLPPAPALTAKIGVPVNPI